MAFQCAQVVNKKFDLQQQYTCLELITTAFRFAPSTLLPAPTFCNSEVIAQIGKSRAREGELLGKVRDSYRALFRKLVDNVVQVTASARLVTTLIRRCKMTLKRGQSRASRRAMRAACS
jgi:hypothetical protein